MCSSICLCLLRILIKYALDAAGPQCCIETLITECFKPADVKF